MAQPSASGVFYTYGKGFEQPVWENDTTDATRTQARAYGGSLGSYQAEVDRLGEKADGALKRAGYQFDTGAYDQARGQADEARGQQQYGLGMLRDQMDTSQGSAATRAIYTGGQKAAAMQGSLATTARGGMLGRVAALQQARQNQLTGGQQTAQQANVVRAQEAQSAMLGYGQAAGQMRGLDAASQAQASQMAQAQADARQRNDEGNAGRIRDAEGLRTGILGAQQQQVIKEDQQDLRRGGIEASIRDGNADRADRLAAAGMSAGAAAAGGVAKGATELFSSQSAPATTDPDRWKRDQEVALSDERQKAKVTPMASAKKRPMSDAEARKAAEDTDRMFGPDGETADRIGRDAKAATDQPMAEGVSRALKRGEPRAAYDDGGEDIAEGTRNALGRETTLPREMMRSTDPYAFNYAEGSGEDPTKRRYGVMAQDLEATPMGASLVEDTPRGKMVDTKQATMAQFAALSDLQAQLDQLRKGPAVRAR